MRTLEIIIASILCCVSVKGAFWSLFWPQKPINNAVTIYEPERFVNPDLSRRIPKQTEQRVQSTLFLPEYPYSLFDWKCCAAGNPIINKNDIPLHQHEQEPEQEDLVVSTTTPPKGMLSYFSHLYSDTSDKLEKLHNSLQRIPSQLSAMPVPGGCSPLMPGLVSAAENKAAVNTDKPDSGTTEKTESEASEPVLVKMEELSFTDKINSVMNRFKGAHFHLPEHLEAYSPFPSIRRQTKRALAPLLQYLDMLSEQYKQEGHSHNGISRELLHPAEQFLGIVHRALHPEEQHQKEVSVFDSSWSQMAIPFDVKESKENYGIIADVPAGVTAADITVELSPNPIDPIEQTENTMCTVTIIRKEEHKETLVNGEPVTEDAGGGAINTVDSSVVAPATSKVIHRERKYGKFRRVFQLPADVTAEEKSRITATVNHKHELEIVVPRKPQKEEEHLHVNSLGEQLFEVATDTHRNINVPVTEM